MFTRKGADVHVELPISVPEALLGASIPVPTIDGPVRITVPAGSNSGRTLRLKGRGIGGPEGRRGDQYVRLLVTLPEAPDAELEQWASGATTTSGAIASRGEPSEVVRSRRPRRRAEAGPLSACASLAALVTVRLWLRGRADRLAGDLHLINDGGMTYAGHIAFMTLFSSFPFLIFLTTLAAEIGQTEAAQEFVTLVLGCCRPRSARRSSRPSSRCSRPGAPA